MAEKQRLEAPLSQLVIGYRNHYLWFRVPDLREHPSRAGFCCDTTIGYADCVGFRNGMCHPFKPYDLQAGQEIDILEIPLAVMDRTLDRCRRLGAGETRDVTRYLIDTPMLCHGVLPFSGTTSTFYEKILRCCKEKGAWMASGKEIRGWWENND